MIRLCVTSSLAAEKAVTLDDKQIHYVLHVMRLSAGDSISLFNGRDGEWTAEIQTLTKKQGILIPTTQTKPQTTDKKVILCPALIKKENMDFVLQKATELGVTDIWPIVTDRTVVRQLNRERAGALLREAAEQCERLTVPIIKEPQPLRQVLADLPRDIIPVFLSERGETSAPIPPDKTVAFFVGPEGGFTPAEITLLATAPNSIFCHLGHTILRAETASIAILSCYQFHIFG